MLHEVSPTAGFVVRAHLLHATEETLNGVLRAYWNWQKFREVDESQIVFS